MLPLPPLLLPSLILSSSASTDLNFSAYPACARAPLANNVPTLCDFGDASPAQTQQTDNCLCSSVPFLSGSAKAIYGTCGCEILNISAHTLVDLCDTFETPCIWTVERVVSEGDGDQAVCRSQGAANATAVQPSVSGNMTGGSSGGIGNDGGGGGLGTHDEIVIGVVVPVVVLVLGSLVALFIWRFPRAPRADKGKAQPEAAGTVVEMDDRARGNR